MLKKTKDQRPKTKTIEKKLQNVLIFLVCGFGFISLIFGLIAHASTANDLKSQIEARQQEIKNLELEIAKYQSSLVETQAEKDTLERAIARHKTQIKKLQADIALTQKRLEQTELLITSLSGEIKEKEEGIARNRESLAETLRVVRARDETSYIALLLGNSVLSEFFGELEALERLEERIKNQLGNLYALREDLTASRKEAEVKGKDLQSFREELGDRHIIAEENKRKSDDLLKDTKNKEVVYHRLLDEREAKRAKILEELTTIEDELRRLIDPSLLPTKAKGILAWPLKDPFVTQGFGLTDFATSYGSDVYNGKGHNGVDFRAPIGTPLYAAEDGTIKAIGNTDTVCPGGSYGKWIIIDHANNLSTLYAHLSLIKVASGQAVKRGDLIGYSGRSGYVTGPHLHLTVYASQTFRLAQTIHCGKVPAGGYIDPLDYLGS
ncbi:MAG: peptidoglycan DD-metalloendopeptidase family protein [Patescibacteria group bacterium]